MKKNLIILLIIFVFLGLLVYRKEPQKVDRDFAMYANQIVEKCSSSIHNQSCYDKEVPKLMDNPVNLSMEEAFQVTRLIQGKDGSFPYCHVLGHNLSAKEVKKDPAKWKEVLSRCPSGVCSNGCIHGGFQERFRAESFTDEQVEDIKPDLKSICEKRSNWNPTGLEQASCYHALGHLTMYITDAEINKSIKLCEEIALKLDGRSFLQVCLDGVFMQIYQPLEPEDFALIVGKEVTRDQVDSFCNTYSGFAKASCLSESWPLYRQDIMNDPAQLIKFCSKEEQKNQARCYNGLFYVLVAQFNFDVERIKNYCLGLLPDLQGMCFASTTSRMIETDYRNIGLATNLCSNITDPVNKKECFDELLKYSTYNFHAGSAQFLKLCNGLPDPWKERCLK